MDEAYRLAQAIAAGGLAPQGMAKPEQIMVAIMAGAELGLPPFQALQSFAVVNGRPCIWGDGLLGVVLANGVRVREWHEGDTAFCEVHALGHGADYDALVLTGGRQARGARWKAGALDAVHPAHAADGGLAPGLVATAAPTSSGEYRSARRWRTTKSAESLCARSHRPRRCASRRARRLPQIEIVDIEPSDALGGQDQSEPEVTHQGEEGAAASSPGEEEPLSMVDHMLDAIGKLSSAHQANDYERANEAAIGCFGRS